MRNLFNKLFPSSAIPEDAPVPTRAEAIAAYRREYGGDDPELRGAFDVNSHVATLAEHAPTPPVRVTVDGIGMDSTEGSDGQGDGSRIKSAMRANQPAISDALAEWYCSFGFIGHQLAAVIAQHWLVNKACSMPAEDAIRKGFVVTSADGDDLPEQVTRLLNRADRKYNLRQNMTEFVRKGRIFGIRICIFVVDGIDYCAPFNIDGVKPGSYKGMVQVDPYWCAPELDGASSSQPDTMHFYEPTWWNINGVRYHRSHLIVFRNGELTDLLKPSYLYGGMPVPQQIMERIYGAERTANEAPLLAMTKRTTVYKTDTGAALANFPRFKATVDKWSAFWNNNGIRVIGLDDEVNQIDTALTDLDAIIMTQYQLVAAASNVPSTKIMGTSPKGFGASGDYEESSYHEFLESVQTHGVTPLVDRHHALAMASDVVPQFPEAAGIMVTVDWNPLDTQTELERAQTDLAKAQTGFQLVQSGAIDGIDERDRIRQDRFSDYAGIAEAERPTPNLQPLPAVAPTGDA